MPCHFCADKQAEIDFLRAENRHLGEQLIYHANRALIYRRRLLEAGLDAEPPPDNLRLLTAHCSRLTEKNHVHPRP